MKTHIDDDLIGPICELADLEITGDKQLNRLIKAAQVIRDREGFLVVDGDDADFLLPTSELPSGER
jgi:hypothetical protein